ncbi:hypothetical protein B0H16DRAFT_693654 [Mycena metata]|uniref:Uncharacterized protein n=1 Tax=Mycena metata TaxID=1033252 RepID=A0AAD7NDD9_9AGAR|nr:hypothetical protein B0H16DRAFT_565419 [Mycena metata]KAJ7756159.1 hypothetical protein B0H16DRAFT_693654 [Mycena metata]
MLADLGVLFRRALALLLLADVAYCQTAQPYDPSGFNFVGTIDAMTLNVSDGVLAGGSITVNNIVVTVPKNLIVTLPSINVAWSELFTVDGNNKATPNLPLLGTVSWEATIFGNIVSGQRIAGIVYIIQESTQFLQGFVTKIDYTTGHFWVDTLECLLNDPVGRFGIAYTDNPLWTVDPDSPSIRASTGVPLCIPRNATDSECPLTNRPTDGNGFYLTAFTFPAPDLVEPGGPDPRIMVPIVVGDYITFSGTKIAGDILAVYSLEANLGIYTAPGTQPAYVTCEAANYAIVVADPTLEADETRATAMVSDPTTPIQWYAIDVDPCTGEETQRDLLLAQGSGTAPIGRTVFRLGKVDANPATRQVGFRYTNGVSPGPRGLVAGQFEQPIFVYTFPELIDFGANEPANQFQLMPYIAQGSGPFEYGNFLEPPLPTPTIVGQLDPWPGAIVPGTTSCAPPSSTTATTSSASSTPTGPAGITDVINILSATTRNQKGRSTF